VWWALVCECEGGCGCWASWPDRHGALPALRSLHSTSRLQHHAYQAGEHNRALSQWCGCTCQLMPHRPPAVSYPVQQQLRCTASVAAQWRSILTCALKASFVMRDADCCGMLCMQVQAQQVACCIMEVSTYTCSVHSSRCVGAVLAYGGRYVLCMIGWEHSVGVSCICGALDVCGLAHCKHPWPC
jgi:hypothetical protein